MRRLSKIFVVIIPLLIIVVAAAAAWWRERLGPLLTAAVESRLSAALEREVRVGRISGGLLRGAVLHDVRIAERERLEQGVMVRARRVALRYRLRAALLGRQGPAAALDRLDISGVRLNLTRDERGQWNIAPLLKPKVVPAGRFRGVISFSDTTIVLIDHKPPRGLKRPFTMRFANVTGRIVPHARGGALLRFRAANPDFASQRISVSANITGGHVIINAVLSGADLGAWGERLSLKDVRLLRGTAEAKLTGVMHATEQRASFDYLAQVEVRGAGVRWGGLRQPVSDLAGSIVIAPDQMRLLGLSGALGATQFRVSGLISDLRRPQLHLNLTAREVNRGLLRALGLRAPGELQIGPGSAEVAVRGSAAEPVIAGAVRLPWARLRHFRARDLSANLVYDDRVLWLREVKFAAAQGEVSAAAWCKFGAKRVKAAFEGEARNLNLARLLAECEVESVRRLQGIVRARFAGAYDESGLRAAGSVELERGQVDEVELDAARAVAAWQQGNLRIASAAIESAAGSAVLAGTVGADRQLNLEARAADLDLAVLAQWLGSEEQLRGRGFLAGSLRGTLDDPVASGQFQLTEAHLLGRDFDLISGKLTASRTTLSGEGILAYEPAARYTLSGTLTGLDQPRDRIGINAHLEVGYARLADVLAQAEIEAAAAGDVEAALDLTGTVGSPAFTGWARVRGPSWHGWSADEAEAQFEFADGVLHLRRAAARAGDSAIMASGDFSAQAQLDMQLSADLELGDLRPPESWQAPLDLAGRVIAEGHIRGTRDQPQVTLRARAQRLVLEGETFSDLRLQTVYSEHTRRNDLQASFAQGDARYEIQGWADLEAQTLDLRAALSQGQLARLRSVFQRVARRFARDSAPGRAGEAVAALPSPIQGIVDAQASITGPWRKPAGEVAFQTRQASVAGAPVPDATAEIGIGENVVYIHRFEARQGDAYATARGRVDLQGAIAVELDAYNLDAGLLRPWLGLEQELSGSADVALSIGGTLNQPQVLGSAEVSHLGAGAVRADEMRAARFEVAGDLLRLDEGAAVMGPHTVRIGGAIPLSWKPLGVDPARPLSLALDLAHQDLGLLTFLLPDIAHASGPLDGRLEISGTSAEPQLDGVLNFSRGSLRLHQQGTRLDDIEGAVRFQGRRALVERLSARVGGGAIAAQGEVGLTSFDPSKLMANRFALSITGRGVGLDLGAAFEGKADTDLALVTSADGRATLRGQVTLTSGRLGVPRQGKVQALAVPPWLDFGLDIDVALQRDLWLRTPTISVQVLGAGHIGGHLAAPSAAVMVESRRGTLHLPGAALRVTYVSMDATVSPPRVTAPGAAPAADVRASLRLEAEGRVRGYQVYVSMSGPLTDPAVEPHIELRSVPALDEESLWAMLTGLPVGPTAPEIGGQARALLTTGLGAVALYPFERAAARILGLEEFGVEYTQYEPMRVRLGGYVLENLYATYLRSLSGPPQTWDFTLGYQVLPTLSLGVRVNERNQTFWEALTTRRF